VQPDPGLAWHLYFWLRQLQLEVAQDTADYLSRTLPTRRAIIRRLAEHLFSISLSGWSTAAMEVSYRLEQARWVKTWIIRSCSSAGVTFPRRKPCDQWLRSSMGVSWPKPTCLLVLTYRPILAAIFTP